MRISTSLLLLTLFACNSTFKAIESPTNYTRVVSKNRTQGVIFLENGDCFLCLQNEKRFSPTLADLDRAERILDAKIREINRPLINQGNGCPIIHKNLKYYRRQYFGYIDEKGNQILYVTFNWDRYTLWSKLKGIYKDESDNWKKEKSMTLDGCSYHWEIKINLTKQELFDLAINGVA